MMFCYKYWSSGFCPSI